MPYRIAETEAIRIVGIRTSLTEDMEENQRIVPDFWKDTLEKEQFSDICLLSNENPKGILGISVYHDPDNIFLLYSRCHKQRNSHRNVSV